MKKKMISKLLSAVLVTVMASSLLAGCGSSGTRTEYLCIRSKV